MKHITLLLISIITLSCTAQKKEATAVTNKDGDLVGVASKEHFLTAPYSDWFNYGYNDYNTNTEITAELKSLLQNKKIKVFMGTWCGDSQEQVPYFYKILDNVNFNVNNLEMIAVNNSKKTPTNLEKGFDIFRVPTFIFYNEKGDELGRIVEYPMETLEADMVKILSGKPYTHAYENE